MPSKQQRRLNFFHRHFVKPLRLFDAKPLFKRSILNCGSYFLSTKTKAMRFHTKALPVSNGTLDVIMCSEGDIRSETLIFYLHGGGFSTCGPSTHRHFAARLAMQCQGQAALIDYPLSPKHKFPIALNQIVEAYHHFLSTGHNPANIIIAGDSAGGNLVAALLYMLEQTNAPPPAGVILFSPLLDLTLSMPSHIGNQKTEILIADGLQRSMYNSYIGDADPLDPRASPLFAKYETAPPTLIFAAKGELLIDEATEFYRKLKSMGTDVSLITEEDVPHVWPIQFGRTPEADKAIAQCKEFMARL